MSQKTRCSNPDCGHVFEAADARIGEEVKCPKCGTPSKVLADFDEQFDISTVKEAGEGEKMAHPARQTCPNCGAVLGVRAVFCPQCGADIRTGALAEVKKVKKKLNITPFLIGGGIIVALAVLVGLVVFAVKLVGEREEGPEAEGPPVVPGGAPIARVQAPAAEGERPAVRVAEEQLGSLAQEEQQARQAVDAYLERLKGTLGHVRTASSEEMARHWAELYSFCVDTGLQTEAEQCWSRAVCLRPTDSEVNKILGRTETFDGVPVTPEQKRFLDGLRPRLQITNCNVQYGHHAVRVGFAEPVAIPCGATVEFSPTAGTVKIEVVDADRPDAGGLTFSLEVQPGLVYKVELRAPAAAPPLPFAPLSLMYAVVEEGHESETVRVERNWDGAVVSARSGNIRGVGTEEAPLQLKLSARRDSLSVVGALMMGDRYADEGQDVFYGDRNVLLLLVISDGTRPVVMSGGGYCRLRVDLADSVWKALAVAEGDFGSEWQRRRLAERLEQISFDNAEKEAEGQLAGPWEGDGRTYEGLESLRGELKEELARLERAALKPYSLDRVRAFGIDDREAHLHLNWPRFRQALAVMTKESHEAVLAQLDRLTAQEAPSRAQARGSGSARRPGAPAEWEERGAGYAGAMAAPKPVSPFAPDSVVLGGQGRLYAVMKILPMLPDEVALKQVQDNWDSLSAPIKVAALVALETVGTQEAVDYIGRRSREGRDPLIVAALLSLGSVGTPGALGYCDAPGLTPAVRTAAMAAKAVGGDPDALDELPEFLAGSDEAVKRMFADYASGMDTPATVLVLSQAIDACTDPKSQEAIAGALARIGGHAAMVELARLMEKAGTAFPEALDQVEPQDGVLLVRPVGTFVASGTGGQAAILFLLRMDSDAALAFLKAALGGTGGSAVVEGLANEGSLEALEAAGDGASLASLGLLEKLRGLWYSIDQETGDCVWKAGLDSAAAVGFLQKVTAQSADAKARIAAARMLQEVGQPADGQVLVALAQEMKATGVVAPARPEGRRRGRDMGRDMGPPPGVMMGPGGPARPTGPYVPSGFEEPAGAPKPPEDFVLEGKSQFYALSLLVEAGDEAASARLREVVDGYEDAKLQVATMRALGAIGGEANLAFLRQKATGRKGNYENIQAFSAECRDRLAALSALGDAQDAAFLTQLLDLLDEGPPAVDAIPEVKDEYGKLSVWWPMKLQTGVCKCLAGLCRDRQLVELAADSTLQQQMVRRLISLIDRPVPQQELAGASADLTAAAVQALGRCASFYDETAGFVVKRLAVRLFPAPAAGPEARAGDGFDEPDPRAALRASRQRRRRTGRQGLTDPLKIALRDAVVHMAVRGDGLDVFDEVPGVLPEGDRADPGWNALVKELAEAPTSQYFGLLNRCFDAIDRPTKEAVCALTRGSAAAYGTEHAQFVAKMIKEPPEAIRERPAARAFGRPEGRPDIPDMSPEQLAMIQRERAEARMRGIERDMGGDVEFMPQAPIVRKEDDVAYEREGPRRTQEWSYSLTSQGERRELVRRQWSLVERLFEAGGAAVASAVQEEELVTCPTFGPAIGAMYVERDPEARADVVGQLERILTGATGAAAQPRAARTLAETRVRPRTEPRARQLAGEVSKRAAVAALRKIGGEEAARALFNGLVGPRIPAQRPQMGPMFGPPPGERMRPGGPYAGGAMGAAGMPVAVYIARALGSMGQLDLLRGALNAQGYQFFGQNPQAVREAVLVGIAYLPGDLNPIGILSELLGMASTERLRKAAAEAIETAFRRMAPD